MEVGGKANATGFHLLDGEGRGIEVGTKYFFDDHAEFGEVDSYPFIEAFLKFWDDKKRFDEEVEKLRKELRQWHSAEHKIIYLLINSLPLTLKNIREAPMEMPKCGAKNHNLEEPDDAKLREALRVGKKFLRLREK